MDSREFTQRLMKITSIGALNRTFVFGRPNLCLTSTTMFISDIAQLEPRPGLVSRMPVTLPGVTVRCKRFSTLGAPRFPETQRDRLACGIGEGISRAQYAVPQALIGYAQRHKLTIKWAGQAINWVSAIWKKQVTASFMHTTMGSAAPPGRHLGLPHSRKCRAEAKALRYAIYTFDLDGEVS